MSLPEHFQLYEEEWQDVTVLVGAAYPPPPDDEEPDPEPEEGD